MKVEQIGNAMIFQGDCLEIMPMLINNGVKIDAIITDPPYGTTACKWDSVIPFDKMWDCLNKLIKDNGAIALFGTEPFSSRLRSSNLEMFKYDWYWNKNHGSGFVNAKLKPMNTIEIISVFSKGKTSNGNKNNMVYNPQGLIPYNKVVKRGCKSNKENTYFRPLKDSGKNFNESFQEWTNYPRNYIEFSYQTKAVHPTQKPVDLMEYLVKTYTNEGETVLDFTAGSFTTGVACLNTNRKFIGIELEEKYFEIGKERLEKCLTA